MTSGFEAERLATRTTLAATLRRGSGPLATLRRAQAKSGMLCLARSSKRFRPNQAFLRRMAMPKAATMQPETISVIEPGSGTDAAAIVATSWSQ
jgi:hypothetical protein